MKKRILSSLLTLCMLISVFPELSMTAFATKRNPLYGGYLAPVANQTFMDDMSSFSNVEDSITHLTVKNGVLSNTDAVFESGAETEPLTSSRNNGGIREHFIIMGMFFKPKTYDRVLTMDVTLPGTSADYPYPASASLSTLTYYGVYFPTYSGAKYPHLYHHAANADQTAWETDVLKEKLYCPEQVMEYANTSGTPFRFEGNENSSTKTQKMGIYIPAGDCTVYTYFLYYPPSSQYSPAAQGQSYDSRAQFTIKNINLLAENRYYVSGTVPSDTVLYETQGDTSRFITAADSKYESDFYTKTGNNYPTVDVLTRVGEIQYWFPLEKLSYTPPKIADMKLEGKDTSVSLPAISSSHSIPAIALALGDTQLPLYYGETTGNADYKIDFFSKNYLEVNDTTSAKVVMIGGKQSDLQIKADDPSKIESIKWGDKNAKLSGNVFSIRIDNNDMQTLTITPKEGESPTLRFGGAEVKTGTVEWKTGGTDSAQPGAFHYGDKVTDYITIKDADGNEVTDFSNGDFSICSCYSGGTPVPSSDYFIYQEIQWIEESPNGVNNGKWYATFYSPATQSNSSDTARYVLIEYNGKGNGVPLKCKQVLKYRHSSVYRMNFTLSGVTGTISKEYDGTNGITDNNLRDCSRNWAYNFVTDKDYAST